MTLTFKPDRILLQILKYNNPDYRETPNAHP
jgi:hypothetical protein